MFPAAKVGPVAVVCPANGANTKLAAPFPVGAADNVTVVPLTLTRSEEHTSELQSH